MKFELKDFQETRGRELIEELAASRDEYERRGKLQAIVFSSPTGSGKTITLASVLESLFRGCEGNPARPYSRVLWISDSPELNDQSQNKLFRACDHFKHGDLKVVDAEFDAEYLPSGKVSFINTQLLGKDKKLTQHGDSRTFTFWQTVENTINDYPGDTLLVIDEAHRGMGVSKAERNKRTTTIRKFIDGSPSDSLSPVPVVLGMSATTKRFDEILASSERTTRKVEITPAEVQISGLLKDKLIVMNPKGEVDGDMTLLEEAAKKWKTFENLWKSYCESEKEEIVRPVLVIQVEDGKDHEDEDKRILTKTNLSQVVQVLSRTIGPFGLGALVHCFDANKEIDVGGEKIRRVDASRIQDNETARVVFFKTALSTGWDCPRAEVMMSFRKAVDHTLIAQLIGRMIRTPLARQIESDEVLNTVNLYLPHYDANSLKTIVDELKNPEAEDRPPTDVETETATYERNPDFTDVFPELEKLPTYNISRLRPMLPVKRLLRYASLLTLKDRIDLDAYESCKKLLVDYLVAARNEKRSKDEGWSDAVEEGGEIEMAVSAIDLADLGEPSHVETVRTKLTTENIYRLFVSCGRYLAPGEGLEDAFWRQAHDKDDPDRARLELYRLVKKEPKVMEDLNSLADKEFKRLRSTTQPAIKKLEERSRIKYNEITDRTGKAECHEWELPDRIVERDKGDTWKKHLFCDADGNFKADLNSWETAVVKAEQKREDFVGWLRNRERANWALKIPYEHGGEHSFYPDFVIVRKIGEDYVFDIVEPHCPAEDDTYAKAKGLAQYARDHGSQFGRLLMCKVDGKEGSEEISSFDVNDPDTKEKVLKMKGNNEVQGLYRN